jgi:competence protein ComFC
LNYLQIKDFILDIIFPKFCIGCEKEETYLCEDCKSCLEISEQIFCLCEKPNRLIQDGKCNKCRFKKLDGLYFAVSYQNQLVKKLIHQFKYEPLIKELSKPLADLIISHFLLLNKVDSF